ncbi:MAG TPA: stage III sporulation protein AF [Clostridiales bacterium]|nr:stage III sporulation protein AF [Clostridiales bacterium]
MKRRIIIYIILIFTFYIASIEVKAIAGSNREIEYDEIQNVLKSELNNEIDFESYVNDLISGKEVFDLKNIIKKCLELVKNEIKNNMDTLGKLISIAIMSAIFTNLSLAFKNEQVSETGYYVIYLLLFTILITTFISASYIVSEALESVIIFMKALVPTYFIAVGLSTGVGSSVVFYEMSLIIISFTEIFLLKIILPLINIYLIIMLVNNLSKEDMLSKFADLLATIIKWMLNTLLAAIIGFNTIQGMITPVLDKAKRSALLRASQAIPGIGDAIGGVTETLLGASLVLKNAIGVVGLIIIIVIGTVPLIKLAIIVLIYKTSGAILQPISDKRILKCISASAKSSAMLLHTLFIGVILFILTITIVTISTIK